MNKKRKWTNPFVPLSRLLFLCSALLVTSIRLYAQSPGSTKLSIHFPKTQLDAAMLQLLKASPVNIAYDNNKLRLHEWRIQEKDFNQATLSTILDYLLQKTNIRHKEMAGGIMLFAKDSTKAPGIVTGKVIDEENGDPVTSATVSIGNKNVVTGLDGSFTVSVIPGSYTAAISSVGFGSKKITGINVQAGKSFELNITLVRNKNQLASVVVTSSVKKEGVASLYARQKNSAAVSDGISAEQISRTPDNNAAQSLKRISGLTVQDEKFVTVRGLSERYNNVLLNGASLPSTEQNRRNFSFDIIPSGLIDNIVINKTATPDLPSEFAGGLVQVNTKDIPAANYITLSAGTGINTNSTGKEIVSLRRSDKAWLGFDDNRRTWWGKDWNRAEYSPHYYSGNWEKAAEMNRRIPNNWGLVRYKYQPQQSLQLALGRRFQLTEQSRIGLTIAGTYRNESLRVNEFSQFPNYYLYDSANNYQYNTAWGLIGNIAYQSRRHKLVFKNLYNRKYSQESAVNYGKEFNYRVTTVPGGDDVLYYSDVLVISDLRHHRLEGEHQLLTHLKVDWSVDDIQINRDQPDTRSSIGYQANGPKGHYEYILLEANGYLDRGNNIFNSKLTESKRNAALNISIPFTWKGQSQLLKAGYAGSFRKADFQSSAMRLMADPTAQGQEFHKTIFGIPDYQLQNFLQPGLLTYRYASIAAGDGGEDYTGKQDLHAAYAMADLQFLKRWRLIGGVRMENNFMKIHGVSYDKRTGNPVDSVMSYNPVDWLPSANLIYKLNTNMNLRLAYSKTTARADFRERSPFIYYDFRDRSVYRGAIGLEDAFVENLDLRYEYYPSAGEVVSVSFFHKKFTRPVELIGIGASPIQYFYFNLDESVNDGLEIDFRKKLGFIAPKLSWLQQLYLSGNFSWMKGDVKYSPQALMDAAANAGGTPGQAPGATRDRPLQGLSPYAINASIGYDGKIIGATVSYNRFGKRIVNGGFNPYQDQYENPRNVIDLQVSAKLLKEKLVARLNVNDLLQEDYIIYQNVSVNKSTGNFDTPIELIHSSNPNMDPKGTAYNKDKDLLYRRWFKGRTISLIFTYNF